MSGPFDSVALTVSGEKSANYDTPSFYAVFMRLYGGPLEQDSGESICTSEKVINRRMKKVVVIVTLLEI